jgi:glucokinase
MYKYAAAIGIDIGRYYLRIAVLKIEGDVLFEESYSLKQEQDKDYLLSVIIEAIQRTRQKVAIVGINPICIGIAAKGFINHKAGIVIGPDQGIKNWTNVPLSKIISKETGLPVFIGNDANLMTIAEQKYGVAKGYKNVVFIALRTGIGGGIIINGKLYRGVNNAGGEIGQMIINFSGGVSDIGIRGSFEHFASAEALIKKYYEVSKPGADKKQQNITAKDIFEMSYKNDPTALMVIRENAWLVGIGVANLISIFAPEIIVIGGGMAEANQSYLELIRESAFANSLENCRAEVKIERAQLGMKAALLGSAFYGLTRLAGKTIW